MTDTVAKVIDAAVPAAVGKRTAIVVLVKCVLYGLTLFGVHVPAESEIDTMLDGLAALFAVAHVVR